MVHGISETDMDCASTDAKTRDRVVTNADDILNDTTFITYGASLMQLLSLSPPSTCPKCGQAVKAEFSHVGTAGVINWVRHSPYINLA